MSKDSVQDKNQKEEKGISTARLTFVEREQTKTLEKKTPPSEGSSE